MPSDRIDNNYLIKRNVCIRLRRLELEVVDHGQDHEINVPNYIFSALLQYIREIRCCNYREENPDELVQL